MTRLLLVAAIALATSGCFLFKSEAERAAERAAYRAEKDAQVNAWVGKTTAELLESEGPPSVVLEDPSGMKIWSYTRERNKVVPGAITVTKVGEGYQASQAEGRIETDRFSRMFWIGKDGRIARAAWHEE